MKWLIVEDALRDRTGHWLEYVSTFVRGLTALGDEVVVLCDRQAQGFVMEQTGARPVLPESIWHRMGDGAGALRRYARVPGHAVATFVAMRKFFKNFPHPRTDSGGLIADGGSQRSETGCQITEWRVAPEDRRSEIGDRGKGGGAGLDARRSTLDASSALDSGRWSLDSGEAPDWIFVPTVLVHHLLGWSLLLRAGSVPGDSRVLLFFPNLPIGLDSSGEPTWNAAPTTRLMAWLFEQLRGEVENGKVVLGVETHAMRRALEGLIRMPVVYLPHPVEAQGETRVERRASRASSPATSNSLPVTSAKPIVFGCYGAARWEKGSDILQAAIRRVLEEKPEIPVRFAFQWIEDFNDEHGRRVTLDSWVREHPKVEVIERYFDDGEIDLRLFITDSMVLPYRSPYRLRVSRVVIEAMLNGMPVVATEGTTLHDQASAHGCVLGCEEGSVEGLAKRILEAAANFDKLQRSAKAKIPDVEKSFSVDCFRQLLMNLKIKKVCQ